MTVISAHKDTNALTLTFVTEFDASPERVWRVWREPRLLEKWWGPPTYPATFVTHDFTVGGQSHYYMTGPEGDQPHGRWTITAIDEPHRLEFIDGFATADGEPDPQFEPMRASITLEPHGAGTRMTTVSTFPSVEVLEQYMAMGMEEGMREALGQIDALLAAGARV